VEALAPGKGKDMLIPFRPTHINSKQVAVYQNAGGGLIVQQLPPFTAVTVVRNENGWALIAKDGTSLGYVAEMTLNRLN
jgi:hypothetical protein